MAKIPETNSFGKRELDRAADEFKQFDDQIKSMTMDRLNEAPKKETEDTLKMSKKEVSEHNTPYLKPVRSISGKDKPISAHAEHRQKAWEYVRAHVHHKEILGEDVEVWTHPFSGDAYDFWRVPQGKPVMIPRHLAEQLSRCCYHRLRMDETSSTQSSSSMNYYGKMVVDDTVSRIECKPVRSGFSEF